MAVVGAEGCTGGWAAIRLDQNGTWRPRVFESIGLLWAAWHDASLILVDLPIGLPIGEAERRCDKEARQILGQPRGSSVFPAPCRAALTAATREEASQLNRQVTGIGSPWRVKVRSDSIAYDQDFSYRWLSRMWDLR